MVFNKAQRAYDNALPDDSQSEREEHIEQLANEALNQIISELKTKFNINSIPDMIEADLHCSLCNLVEYAMLENAERVLNEGWCI